MMCDKADREREREREREKEREREACLRENKIGRQFGRRMH